MCLMLYIGTAEELPTTESAEMRVEAVEEARRDVKHWFSHSAVRFIGAHTGCSCGFPSVVAEEPIDFFEGVPLGGLDRSADLQSVRALLALIRHVLASSERVELYPVHDGDESKPPKGTRDWWLDALDPEQFVFTEGFMYVIRQRPIVTVKN